jgi:alanyl-tRNA synthetase
LLDDLSATRRQVQQLEQQLLRASVGGGSAGQQSFDFTLETNGKSVLVEVKSVPASSADALRKTADHIRDRLKSGIVVLGTVIEERPMVVVMVTKDLAGNGLHAGNIAKTLAEKMGGGGGGSPFVAQAGGREGSQLESALASAREVVESAAAGRQEK